MKTFSGKFKLNSCLVAQLEAVAPRCRSKAADLLSSCWSQSLLQKTWPARNYFPQRERNSHISILSRLCQKSISFQGAYVLQHKGAVFLTMLIMKFLCAKDFLETSWRFSPPLGHPVFQLTRTCVMKEKLVFHVFSWYLIKSRVQFRKQKPPRNKLSNRSCFPTHWYSGKTTNFGVKE